MIIQQWLRLYHKKSLINTHLTSTALAIAHTHPHTVKLQKFIFKMYTFYCVAMFSPIVYCKKTLSMISRIEMTKNNCYILMDRVELQIKFKIVFHQIHKCVSKYIS